MCSGAGGLSWVEYLTRTGKHKAVRKMLGVRLLVDVSVDSSQGERSYLFGRNIRNKIVI